MKLQVIKQNEVKLSLRMTPIRSARTITLIAAATVIIATADSAQAFLPADRWTTTASGSAGFRGEPVTLTWSLVPDGTPIPNWQPSNLVAYFDEHFGAGSGGGDLTRRPWFSMIDSAFARWSALGGAAFVYEPHDDGAPHQSAVGTLGVRGDVRLGAALGDGLGRTLASSQYPDTGDIVLNSSESSRFTNPEGSYLRLRNALMHEIGHVLGLDHVISSDAQLLMEPLLTASFDGPQLDEIRGLHYLYGDHLERAHDGAGNDALSLSIPLGLLRSGNAISLGSGAAPDKLIAPSDVDFVSIAHRGDVDYFSFEVSEPAWLDLELTPRGGLFRQASIGEAEILVDANASSDLSLALFAANEAQLAVVDEQPRGGIETLDNFYLPAAGSYFIRVSGSREAVQLYELNAQVRGLSSPEPSTGTIALVLLCVVPRRRRINVRRHARQEKSRRESLESPFTCFFRVLASACRRGFAQPRLRFAASYWSAAVTELRIC
jgi:hypothetical protein